MSNITQLIGVSALLNKPGHHATAAVSCVMNLNNSKDYTPSIEAKLSISDCSRTIGLDLSVYELKDYDNVLYKLKTLEAVIKKVHKALKNSREEYTKIYLEQEAKIGSNEQDIPS